MPPRSLFSLKVFAAIVLLFSVLLSTDDAYAQSPNWNHCEEPFLRGDVDGDNVLSLQDGYLILLYSYAGGSPINCDDVYDVNDTEGINVGDAILVLHYTFLDGVPPEAPFPELGFDEQGHPGWTLCDGINQDGDVDQYGNPLIDEGENCVAKFELLDDVQPVFNDIRGTSEHSDGSIFVVGSIFDPTLSDRDAYVQRISADGQIFWSHAVGGDEEDYGVAIEVLEDGRVFVFGYTTSFGAGELSPYLVEMTVDGDIVDQAIFDIDDDIFVVGPDNFLLVRDPSGDFDGFLLTGSTFGGPQLFNIIAIRVDANLNSVWQSFYGSPGMFSAVGAHGAIQTNDGGFLVYGVTGDGGALVKTSPDGDVVAEDYDLFPSFGGPIEGAVEVEPGIFRILQTGVGVINTYPRMYQAELVGNSFAFSDFWEFESLLGDQPIHLLLTRKGASGLADGSADLPSFVLTGDSTVSMVDRHGMLRGSATLPFLVTPPPSSEIRVERSILSNNGDIIVSGRFMDFGVSVSIGKAGYLTKIDEGVITDQDETELLNSD